MTRSSSAKDGRSRRSRGEDRSQSQREKREHKNKKWPASAGARSERLKNAPASGSGGGKRLNESGILALGPASNFFLQMSDMEEVDNDDGIPSLATSSTALNTVSSSDSMPVRMSAAISSVLESATAGLRLSPVGESSTVGSGYASEGTTLGEGDEHHPTPVKSNRALKDLKIAVKKSSPQSVIQAVTLSSGKGGELLRRDWSYDETATVGDDVATDLSIAKSDGDCITLEDAGCGVADLQEALFHPNPLSRFQDFITENACWSGGKRSHVSRMQREHPGENDSTNARESGEEDTLNGGSSTFASEGDEDTLNGFDTETEDETLANEDERRLHGRGRNRGRSPTEKPGYNSDGESILSSRSWGSPRDDASGSLSSPKMNRGFLGLSGDTMGCPRGEGEGGAEAESVAETAWSQDQAAWMAMTAHRVPPTRDQSLPSRHCVGEQVSTSVNGEGKDDQVDEKSAGKRGGGQTEQHDAIDKIGNVVSRSEYSSSTSWDTDFVEGFFKKLLSTGIQLMLNDPQPASYADGPCLNRSGKLFLQFGVRSTSDGRFEHPRLMWTDCIDAFYAIELLDIRLIRKPTISELWNYPSAILSHSFFLFANSGISLLLEASDEIEAKRIAAALGGITSRLARKIVTGENDWLTRMMQASMDGGRRSLAGVPSTSEVADATVDVTDHLVGTTALMRRVHEVRSRRRSERQHTTTGPSKTEDTKN